jgi:hypothetical protein
MVGQVEKSLPSPRCCQNGLRLRSSLLVNVAVPVNAERPLFVRAGVANGARIGRDPTDFPAIHVDVVCDLSDRAIRGTANRHVHVVVARRMDTAFQIP